MPTGCQNADFAALAGTAGYKKAIRISTEQELSDAGSIIENADGPVLIEIMVTLDSRADLGRPAETAAENRDAFMNYLNRCE
jgi:phosphonopyruvate decarboxylase